MSGIVFLVGAGPGDPGLMTRRSLDLIAEADAILYDRLIPAGALEGARPDAELRYVGKEPGAPALTQEQTNELLVELAWSPPPGPTARDATATRVAYDEPCHLLHAQKISAAPKAVLDALPGITRVALEDADTCCGSAGIYSVLQPELAARIGGKKVEAIRRSGAKIIVTGNPGCLLQIGNLVKEAGLEVEVMHPIELVAAAYRGSPA